MSARVLNGALRNDDAPIRAKDRRFGIYTCKYQLREHAHDRCITHMSVCAKREPAINKLLMESRLTWANR